MLPRRLFVMLPLLLAAACGSLPRAFEEEDEHRERQARMIAASIEENLRRESDENGPPSAAQILRAQAQRRGLVAAAPPAQEKSAGLQPSAWQSLGPNWMADYVARANRGGIERVLL